MIVMLEVVENIVENFHFLGGNEMKSLSYSHS